MNLIKTGMVYKELLIREMNEIEIGGAIAIFVKACNQEEQELYDQHITTIENIDNETFYSKGAVQFNEPPNLRGVLIEKLFLVPMNYDSLYAKVGQCVYEFRNV